MVYVPAQQTSPMQLNAVGFGEACAIAQTELPKEMVRLQSLRDEIESALSSEIPEMHINGRNAARLPNTSSLTFPGIDADALLLNLPGLMMGTGSACTSGAVEPSHVLTAIGLNRELSSATVRLSLGRFVIPSDVQYIVDEIITGIEQMQMSKRAAS